MKLTSKKALEMLNDAKGKTITDLWITHSICVANIASIIAKELSLDVDYAKTLGYIHDYGKAVGDFSKHDINGFNYLKDLGYDEEYYSICLTHGYLNNDVMCAAGGIPEDIPFRTEYIKAHECSIYEKLICLCDLMCTQEMIGIDKRLIDVIIRYGAYSNTQYHVKETYKLKEYFDNLLGYNLYKLFPDIVKYL
ncbi:MAG: HDIG domain-containing protein [bacterium]|nr:HDIG domain-containing protein [bacterium]